MKRSDLDSAPKRGQYDRALSRRDRQDAQRERVIAALGALTAAQCELSISNVVEHAGIGRNTFYEYFDNIEHALKAVTTRALQELGTRVEVGLLDARTPLERVRALSRAWADTLFVNPPLALLALRPQAGAVSSAQHSVLAEYLAHLLAKDLTVRSALPGLNEPLKLSAVAAVFDALSRAQLVSSQPGDGELHALLAELAFRLLR